MRLTAYIVLMFSISAVLYFMGYRPAALWNGMDQPLSLQSILSNITSDILSGDGLLRIGIIFAGVTFAALLAGFSAMYIIPLALLIVTLNYFILPTSFLYDTCTAATCAAIIPPEIKIPLFALLNILLVLAVLNFVRGGA